MIKSKKSKQQPIGVELLKNAPLLKLIHDSKQKSFFTSTDFTNQERADYSEYSAALKQLSEAARELKKGDKVVFNFPDKVKNKASFFGCDYIDHYYVGKVNQPLKYKKRTMMGEDAGFEVVKVEFGNYVYPVSPDSVEFFK